MNILKIVIFVSKISRVSSCELLNSKMELCSLVGHSQNFFEVFPHRNVLLIMKTYWVDTEGTKFLIKFLIKFLNAPETVWKYSIFCEMWNLRLNVYKESNKTKRVKIRVSFW